MKKGFSLVELLIGMALVAVLIGTANVFLFNSLRTAKKAEAQGVTKSEGAYAINSMAQMIKFSRAIESCSDTNLRIRRLNNHLVDYTISADKIASAGAVEGNNFVIAVNLTSPVVTVSKCNGRNYFICPADRKSVDICYVVNRAGAVSIEDKSSMTFESSISLRNIDN